MATARPSISARVGVVEDRSTKPVAAVIAPTPIADAEQRGQQRQPGRDQRAERDDQHDGGDRDADHLGGAGLRL